MGPPFARIFRSGSRGWPALLGTRSDFWTGETTVTILSVSITISIWVWPNFW